MTMLELRHSPWCEELNCVDALEPAQEPQEGPREEVDDPSLDPEPPEDLSISSSLQLVLPSDFCPSRLNSKLPASLQTLQCSRGTFNCSTIGASWGLEVVGRQEGLHNKCTQSPLKSLAGPTSILALVALCVNTANQ